MLELTLHGRGRRDMARVRHSSPTTVMEELQKCAAESPINELAIQPMAPHEIIMQIRTVEEAEVDDMWSVVGKNTHQRWLWPARDHRTGVVLADVWGPHQDAVFFQ
jgi:hypothetical protein